MAPIAVDVILYTAISYPEVSESVGMGIVERLVYDEKDVECVPFVEHSYEIARKNLMPGSIKRYEKAHMLAILQALELACTTIKISRSRRTADQQKLADFRRVKIYCESADAIDIFDYHLEVEFPWRKGLLKGNRHNSSMIKEFKSKLDWLFSENIDLVLAPIADVPPVWPKELDGMQKVKARAMAKYALFKYSHDNSQRILSMTGIDSESKVRPLSTCCIANQWTFELPVREKKTSEDLDHRLTLAAATPHTLVSDGWYTAEEHKVLPFYTPIHLQLTRHTWNWRGD